MERHTDGKVAGAPRAMLFVLGALFVGSGATLGILVLFRPTPFPFDTWWNSVMVRNRFDALTLFAQVMDYVGGGWFAVLAVPILSVSALLILRRPWSAAFFVSAEVASAAAVQVAKQAFGRARPEDILVITDYGSFPSGHVANAATLATVAFILFPRLWVALVGVAWLLLMALSRTVVHAHWISDTLGGALIGIGVVVLVGAAFDPALRRERIAPTRLRPSGG